jgi:hypothetical protein
VQVDVCRFGWLGRARERGNGLHCSEEIHLEICDRELALQC